MLIPPRYTDRDGMRGFRGDPLWSLFRGCRRTEVRLGKVIAIEHLTLDGVMQAPGHADEIPRDGFEHGGWAERAPGPGHAGGDGRTLSSGVVPPGRPDDLRALRGLLAQQEPNPFTEALNRVQKYVASTTLTEPLPWQNSTLLKGDAADAVAGLKRELGENLVVFGSGVLVRSLMPRDLVDELVLLIHPLVLGSGVGCSRQMPSPSAFELVDSATTGTGVVIAIYRPVGS